MFSMYVRLITKCWRFVCRIILYNSKYYIDGIAIHEHIDIYMLISLYINQLFRRVEHVTSAKICRVRHIYNTFATDNTLLCEIEDCIVLSISLCLKYRGNIKLCLVLRCPKTEEESKEVAVRFSFRWNYQNCLGLWTAITLP